MSIIDTGLSTPAITATVPDNPALTEHVAEIRRLGKRVVADVIEIGRHLKECKRIVGHGNWLEWLEREFGWTDDTALNFMRVYEMSKTQNFRDLNLPVAGLYLLAAPSTPQAARDEVISHAESGERVDHKQVRATIAKHKQGPPSPSKEAIQLAADRTERPILEREHRQAAAEQSAKQRKELNAGDENVKRPRRTAAEINADRFEESVAKLEEVLEEFCEQVRKTLTRDSAQSSSSAFCRRLETPFSYLRRWNRRRRAPFPTRVTSSAIRHG